jgi:hypothetical protein
MDTPEKMVGTAHRAEVWAALGRHLVTLLRADEEQRTLHSPHVIAKYSKVSDEALFNVLGVVFENGQRELEALSRWKLVRVDEVPAKRK